MADRKRYSKLHSAFIKEQDYLKTNDGCDIRYRDHVTIGSQHKLEPGQKPVYGEGNFIFTDSNFVDYRYKRNFYNSVEILTSDKIDIDDLDHYDDMFDMVNDDLSEYVYYGSSQELIRSAVEKIIREFPSCLQTKDFLLDGYYNEDNEYIEYEESKEFIVDNQFNIDLLSNELTETDKVNRILRSELANYTVNGESIEKYEIYNYYEEHKLDFINYIDFLCKWEGRKAIVITINDKYLLHYYVKDKELVLTTPDENLYIKPIQSRIDEYFDNLNFIERKLLNRNTYPIYSSKFTIRKKGQTYTTYHTFPTINEYCIDVSSSAFGAYVSKLTEVCEEYDELYSNVINNRLVHEAIKTLDWSKVHTSNVSDVDYDIGTKRVESFLNIIGRGFDDIKNSIDSINPPKYELTKSVDNTNRLVEQNKLLGWELYNVCDKSANFSVDSEKWFRRFGNQKFDGVTLNNEFLKRLNIFSENIISRKGTTEAIDIIFGLFGFGRESYDIKEEFYYIDNIFNVRKYEEFFSEFTEEALGQTPNDITYKLPYKHVNIEGEEYLIPFVESNKDYFNDVYFQSKGGWEKYSEDVSNKYDYTETKSYLRLVSYIEDLTLININDITYGDLLYVSNVENFKGYFPNEEVTHYFTLVDAFNSNKVSSWRPIRKDETLYEKVKYVETIIDKNQGNNPHIGFGEYDLGSTYINILKNPFLYYGNTEGGISDEVILKSSMFTSDLEVLKRDYKIFSKLNISIFNEDRPYKEGEYFYIIENGDKQYFISKVEETQIGSFEDRKDNFMSTLVDDNYYNISDYTVLNSKKLIITNKVENELYKVYFKNVILKYIEQIIPSTTILILNGY